MTIITRNFTRLRQFISSWPRPEPWLRGESGQNLIIVALMMPILLGMLGLVIDVGYALTQKRLAQNAADAAAHAGARALYFEEDWLAAGLEYSAANGFYDAAPDTTVTINNPPDASSAFAGDDSYVQAIIERQVTPAFASILWNGTFTVTAKASASVVLDRWTGGVLTLNETDQRTLDIRGSSQIEIVDGTAHVNSSHDEALYMTGNTQLTAAAPVQVVGGVDLPNWKQFIYPSYVEGAPPLEDPLAGLPEPAALTWHNTSYYSGNPTCNRLPVTVPDWGQDDPYLIEVESAMYQGVDVNWDGTARFSLYGNHEGYDYVICGDINNGYHYEIGPDIRTLVHGGDIVTGGSDQAVTTAGDNTHFEIIGGRFEVNGDGNATFGNGTTIIIDGNNPNNDGFRVLGNAGVHFGDNTTIIIRNGNFEVQGSSQVNFGDNVEIWIDNGNLEVTGSSQFNAGNNVQVYSSSGDLEFSGSSEMHTGDNVSLRFTNGDINLSGMSYFGTGVEIIADNGAIEMAGAGSSEGDEVFMFAGTNLDIGGSGSIDYTPPASGTYKDILYFQSRSSQETSNIRGAGRVSGIHGVFYAPSGLLDMAGSGELAASFIVDKLQLTGDTQIVATAYDSDQFTGGPPELLIGE